MLKKAIFTIAISFAACQVTSSVASQYSNGIVDIVFSAPNPTIIKPLALKGFRGTWISVIPGDIKLDALWKLADSDNPPLNKEKLKTDFCAETCVPRAGLLHQRNQFSPPEAFWHLALYSAVPHLSDEIKRKYVDEISIKKHRMNQFELRKINAEYIDLVADDLVTFAKQIPRTGYVAKGVYLPEYDFDRNGFELRFFDIPTKEGKSSSGRNEYFLNINPEEAERLTNSQDSLRYVYKVTYKKSGRSSDYRQHLESNTVEVFYDTELTKKAFEFSAN